MKLPRANNQQQQFAGDIARLISQCGFHSFIAYQEIDRLGLCCAKEFMPFVWQQMQQCQLAIVVYDHELRGGLIEAGMAYALQIPIWLLHKADEQVSSSMLGCADKVISYQNWHELEDKLAQAFMRWNQITQDLITH